MKRQMMVVVVLVTLGPTTWGLAATLNVPAQYPTIQGAINAAVNGDEVVVAPGAYAENINFNGKAITVRSSDGAAGTTIDGPSPERAVLIQSGEPRAARLDGFTITGTGMRLAWSSPTIANCTIFGVGPSAGAPVDIENGSPLLDHCNFENNTNAGNTGAAVAIWGASGRPEVRDCTFVGNSAPTDRAGAVCLCGVGVVATLANCMFTSNSAATDGGAILFICQNASLVQDCAFVSNSATSGGAVYVGDGASPRLERCSFDGNSASQQGGAAAGYGNGSLAFGDCTFTGNHSGYDGGAVRAECAISVERCAFSGNTAAGGGGAVTGWCWATVIVALTDCTFDTNQTTSGNGGAVAIGNNTALVATRCAFNDNTAPAGGAIGVISPWASHVADCTFRDNQAIAGDGGAIRAEGPMSIDRSSFSGNFAAQDGGGAVNAWCWGDVDVTFSECLFQWNSTNGYGGAIANGNHTRVIADRCQFTGNQAFSGGAVYAGPPAAVSDSAFLGNVAATEDGGAVYARWNSGLTIDRCVFTGNVAQRLGGAIGVHESHDLAVRGCLIADNLAVTDAGGGIWAWFSGGVNRIDDCTIVNNTATRGGGLETIAAIQNSILYANLTHSGQLSQITGTDAPVTFSNVQGGYPGTGNIDADPRFFDPDHGDYRLGAGSPCVDAGDNASVPADLLTDLDGNPRISDGNHDGVATVDMGAYEAVDCNHNGVPDWSDIALGTSQDCNGNLIPDECDIAAGVSVDCNNNGVPDECEVPPIGPPENDVNANGIPDDCEDQTCRNLTTGVVYPTIAAAIAASQNGHQLLATELAFMRTPNVDFSGKQVRLMSDGAIPQPAAGLINITNNAELATAAGETVTVRGALRSANAAAATVSAGRLVVAGPNGALRARLGSTLTIDTTEYATLDGLAYVEANATMNFTGEVTNLETVTVVGSGTFSVGGPFTNGATFGTLNSNVILTTATNAGNMNLPNVLLLADHLTNAAGGHITGHGQLYTDLTNAGDLTIVNNTTLVGDVLNEAGGLIVLQLGTTTLVGTLTNQGGLVGQFASRGGALDIVGDFVAGADASLAIPAGARLSVTGDYDVAINDHTRYAMTTATLQLRGAARTQYLEAMSRDRGPVLAGLDPQQPGNFPLGTLHIGPSAAVVELVDARDNDGLGQAACEAIYADTVVIHAGATLINPLCKIYYNTLVNEGMVTNPANLVHIVTTPPVCPGDCDCDGHVGFSDIDFFVQAIPDNEPAWRALYAARHGGQPPTCSFANCDATGDGHVNFADIDPFVALIPSSCP